MPSVLIYTFETPIWDYGCFNSIRGVLIMLPFKGKITTGFSTKLFDRVAHPAKIHISTPDTRLMGAARSKVQPPGHNIHCYPNLYIYNVFTHSK